MQPERSRKDYTKLAEEYDESRFGDSGGRFLARTDASIVKELSLTTGASLCIDVPAGTGRVLNYLQDVPMSIIGCDVTEAMLRKAQQHEPTGNTRLVLCDATQLPFATASVDYIISLRFFHLFPPAARVKFVQEFERVLKPGGHLLCSFTNGWYAGGINWLGRALGLRNQHFLMPGEISRLFPRFKICALRGNFLPFQRFLSVFGYNVEAAARWFTAHSPLNRLCWERYYLLQRTV